MHRKLIPLDKIRQYEYFTRCDVLSHILIEWNEAIRIQSSNLSHIFFQIMTMFSVMTALLSPRVLETLESRKEVLFSTLQERAGVLCVQPSNGICLLQGEWECMKKAYVVLEEF